MTFCTIFTFMYLLRVRERGRTKGPHSVLDICEIINQLLTISYSESAYPITPVETYNKLTFQMSVSNGQTDRLATYGSLCICPNMMQRSPGEGCNLLPRNRLTSLVITWYWSSLHNPNKPISLLSEIFMNLSCRLKIIFERNCSNILVREIWKRLKILKWRFDKQY